MADPATQFQQAGLNVPYSYTPVETKLNPPIQLQAADWAQVGRTALAAGDMLQNSALNPAVRAKMQYGIDQYKFAQDHLAWLRSKGDWGQMTAGTGAEGVSTVPAGTTSIDTAVRMGLLGQPAGGGGGGKGKGHDVGDGSDESEKQPTTATTSRTDLQTDAEGVQWFFNPTTSNWERLQTSPEHAAPTTKPKPALSPKDRPKDPSDLLTLNTQVPSQGGSTAALSAGPGSVLNTGQPQSSDIEAVPAAQYRAQQQGGSIWSPQRPSPLAPPAPTTAQPPPAQQLGQGPQMTLGATAQPPPGMELAGTEQAFSQQPPQPSQAAMASWQAQNAHPVMASGDALNWAKNFDTGAQRATYLPNGGPNGEPAYAFHMKGGGINTVPISQIVKNGGGATVAGQNTSAALSTSDALSQQPPPGQAQPGMTLGATAQAPPGMNLGQGQPDQLASGQAPIAPPAPSMTLGATAQPPGGVASLGQPPPAPGMTDIQGNPLSAYTNVPSKGGPVDVTAGAAAAGQPTEPGTTAPPVPNVGQEQPLTHLTGHSLEELSKMDSDPPAGSFAGFNWYQDRHDGRFYTTMKSPSSTLNEQRNYWGGPGWQDMPMENSGLRQALRDAIKTTRGITFSDAETRDMPIDDVKFWLEEAKYLDKTGGDPSGTTALHILGTTQQAKSITRMIDAIEAAKKAGVNPKEYSQLRVDQSRAAAERDAIMPDDIHNPEDVLRGIQARLHDWKANGGPVRPLADELSNEAQYFGTQMGQTPGITYTAEAKPENRGAEFRVAGIPIHLPGNIDVSPLQQINRIFATQPPDDVIKSLKEVRQKLYDDINSSTDLASRLNFRTPPSFKAVKTAIDNGQDIPDKGNKFKAGLPSDEMLHGKPIPPPPSNFYQQRLQPLLDKWFGQQNVQNVENTFLKNTVFGGPQESTPAPSSQGATTPDLKSDELTDFIKNNDNGTKYTAIGADGKKHTYQVTK